MEFGYSIRPFLSSHAVVVVVVVVVAPVSRKNRERKGWFAKELLS